jgi:hypothetical protein
MVVRAINTSRESLFMRQVANVQISFLCTNTVLKGKFFAGVAIFTHANTFKNLDVYKNSYDLTWLLSSLRCGDRRSVTGDTFFGSRFIEQYNSGFHRPLQLVASFTLHVLVSTLQRERSLLVIKQRRLPFGAVVAFGASRDLPARELIAMHVQVAVLALAGRKLEIDVQQACLKIRWLVAVNTRSRSVCSL